MRLLRAKRDDVTLDWAAAQGQGGLSLDNEIHHLRSMHEPRLHTARGLFDEKAAQAEFLHQALTDHAAGACQAPPVDTRALLMMTAAALPAKAAALRNAKQVLEGFRVRHGITRTAYKSKTGTNLLVLGILVFIEAGINAGFFYSAHIVGGPFSALLISMLISLTNVGVSACGGYFIGRWLSYGQDAADAAIPKLRARRRRARWQFAGFVVAIVLLHLTVGLVRALESLDQIDHGIASYAALLSTPEALFLVLIGLSLSVVAYHKGLHAFDDPYPGYGQCQRAVTTARKEVQVLHDGAAAQIMRRYAGAQRDAGRALASHRRIVLMHRRAIHNAHRAKRRLTAALSRAEIELRARIARLVAHHSGAQGKSTPLSNKTLEQLSAFPAYLEGADLPPAYLPPDGSVLRRDLARARDAALKDLSTVFEKALDKTYYGVNQ